MISCCYIAGKERSLIRKVVCEYVVSRSRQMVDLTVGLYAEFWVNGTFNEKTLFS